MLCQAEGLEEHEVERWERIQVCHSPRMDPKTQGECGGSQMEHDLGCCRWLEQASRWRAAGIAQGMLLTRRRRRHGVISSCVESLHTSLTARALADRTQWCSDAPASSRRGPI